MDRDTVRPVVIALLCILAISLAAATLNSAVTDDGSGTGFGSGSGGTGFGENNRSSTNGEQGAPLTIPIELPCFPVLMTWPAIAAILAGFFLLVGIAYWRAGFLGSFAVIGPVGVPVLLVHALLTACTVPPLPRSNGSFVPGNRSNFTLPPGGSGGPGEGATSVMTPSVALFVILGIALVGAVVLLFKSSGGNELETAEDEDVYDADEDIAAVGRAAGDAADRIESEASVENEVYRAWREMTHHLDVSAPESSTPGEFAAAAVDAGMNRDDVSELTNVFEEVRYGGEDATGDRERRAVSALRRIERHYAEADS